MINAIDQKSYVDLRRAYTMIRDYFHSFPTSLQKLLLTRLILSLAALLLFIALLILRLEFILALPALVSSAAIIVSCVYLFLLIGEGRFVVVEGICVEIKRSIMRKYARSILIESSKGRIQIALKQQLRQYKEGMRLRVYLSEKTPVYEKEGCLQVFQFLAMETLDYSGGR